MPKNISDFNPFFNEKADLGFEVICYKEKLPTILNSICVLLKKFHPNISEEIILQMIFVKLAQMFCGKRIKYDEAGKTKYPNWFAMIFLQSGGGKDRLFDDLDKYVFKGYHRWFENEVNKWKITKELNAVIIDELEDATTEGLYVLGQSFSEFNFGSIFIKMSELGFYIKNATKQQVRFLNSFCQLYDCKIPAKIIKSEKFEKSIENIPINVLAYSDFTMFINDIKYDFERMLIGGLCRRFNFSFQRPEKLICTKFSDDEERQYYADLTNYGRELFEIFDKIPIGVKYKLTPSAKNLLNNYKTEITNLHNEIENELQKREIKSRELKALKLSCLLACINHPTEFEINDLDMEQAIENIKFLSNDLEKFIKFRPRTNDKYEKLYLYLKAHKEYAYSQTELVNIACRMFGFTRRPMLKEIDSSSFGWIMSNVARGDDYDFCVKRHGAGTYYYVQKRNSEPAKVCYRLEELSNCETIIRDSL